MGFSSDRLDHAGVLFNHLDRLGKEVNEIFKKEYQAGDLHGALPSSKVENFRATVLWLETLLIPYLGKQYDTRRKILQARFEGAWKKQDLHTCFLAINENAQILVLEAGSHGFLMRQIVSGDWMIDETKKDTEAEP